MVRSSTPSPSKSYLKILVPIKSSLDERIFELVVKMIVSPILRLFCEDLSVTIGIFPESPPLGLRKMTGHLPMTDSDLTLSSSLSVSLTPNTYSPASRERAKVTVFVLPGVILRSKILPGSSLL